MHAFFFFFSAGPPTTLNGSAGASHSGTFEHTGGTSQQQVADDATNNEELVSGVAILEATTTSTHVGGNLITSFWPTGRTIPWRYLHEVIVIVLMVAASHCATVATKNTHQMEQHVLKRQTWQQHMSLLLKWFSCGLQVSNCNAARFMLPSVVAVK